MGFLGKMLLGTVVGVGAVAAAPFTGGGSLLGGATLVASLAGAGVTAGVAGVGGAIAGAVVQGVQDEFKEEQIKEAKVNSFKDGMNEAKSQTVNELKKHNDFYLATTALSYYIARCDGYISEEEQMEIDFDLDAIKKNVDIPNSIKREMDTISQNTNITFNDVKKYLDRVSINVLRNLVRDIDEIIEASDGISPEEAAAKEEFMNYLSMRSE